MLVSVIIALYNKENLVSRCLESLINQTYENIEIIIINDGSTDKSLDICLNFQNRDSRIKIINQVNQGVGQARSIGIKSSLGDYSIHVDPDDWVELNFIEELVNSAIINQSSIVFCDFDVLDETGNFLHTSIQNPNDLTGEELMAKVVSGKIHGSLANKFINNKLFKDYKNFIWPTNLSFCEDQIIIIQLLKINPKISYVNKALYHYIQYKNSITNNYQNKYIIMVDNYLKTLKNITGYQFSNVYYTSVLYFKKYLYSIGIGRKNIYFFYYFSNFRISKSYLDTNQKKYLYGKLFKIDRAIIKCLNKVL